MSTKERMYEFVVGDTENDAGLVVYFKIRGKSEEEARARLREGLQDLSAGRSILSRESLFKFPGERAVISATKHAPIVFRDVEDIKEEEPYIHER